MTRQQNSHRDNYQSPSHHPVSFAPFLWIHDKKNRVTSRIDITEATWFTSQVNPTLQRPNGEELHSLNSKGKTALDCSSPVPAVARMVAVIAMTCSLVGARTLMPVISVVVTLLLVLPRMIGALPGPAPGTRRAPAARFPWFVCRVFIVFWFLVTSHLGTFVTGTVVELSWGRVTAAPRTAVGLRATWRGITFTFPRGRKNRKASVWLSTQNYSTLAPKCSHNTSTHPKYCTDRCFSL